MSIERISQINTTHYGYLFFARDNSLKKTKKKQENYEKITPVKEVGESYKLEINNINKNNYLERKGENFDFYS